MRPATKMLMISSRSEPESRRRGSRARSEGEYEFEGNRIANAYESDGNYIGNRVENRFRDRRGREHYDNGRFAPMRSAMDEPEDNYDVESRRRYRRYRDGRFAPRSEMEGEPGMHYPVTPYIPPVYEREGGGHMRMIGFERRNEMPNNYGMRAEHHRMDEMEHRSSDLQHGHGGSHSMKLTREMADEWVHGMENEDGSKGPHWSFDQVSQVLNQKGMDADPVEFYAVMNALYSDFEPVFKKFGVSNLDFYRELAKCWIKDKDAVPNKAAAYYKHIVK